MKRFLQFSLSLIAIFQLGHTYSQCDPSVVSHYNMGDFPFTSSTGVTVTQGGTNSGVLGPYGPYGCSAATCEANTIRMDPGDTTVFTFSQPVSEITFIAGVMNTTENGVIITNGGPTTLTSNCPSDLSIVGTAFEQVGALASPVITVSVPAGMTEMKVTSLPAASTNGVFTLEMLDCITPAQPCTPSSSNQTVSACDSYLSPAGNTYTSSGTYYDTIPNSTGCDSLITTNLVVNTSDSITESVSACDSYYWPVNGQTYTSSGVYTASYTNSAGCDSSRYLTLSIQMNNIDISVTQNGAMLTSNEAGASYQWLNCDQGYSMINGETLMSFTPPTNPVSGNYAVEITQGACVDTSACYLVDYTGIDELFTTEKKLIKITDFMGRETQFVPNIPLLYIYSDGTIERRMEIEE